MKKLFYLFVVLILFVGCSEEESDKPIGKVVSFSSCKNQEAFYKSSNQSETCIQYRYDGINTLFIKHINAGFNCCPSNIFANITMQGNKIVIEEKEAEQGCRCLCLYDIEIEVNNVTPGNYTIAFVEPYASNGPSIEFDALLNSAIEDTLCLGRDYYPWGNK